MNTLISTWLQTFRDFQTHPSPIHRFKRSKTFYDDLNRLRYSPVQPLWYPRCYMHLWNALQLLDVNLPSHFWHAIIGKMGVPGGGCQVGKIPTWSHFFGERPLEVLLSWVSMADGGCSARLRRAELRQESHICLFGSFQFCTNQYFLTRRADLG